MIPTAIVMPVPIVDSIRSPRQVSQARACARLALRESARRCGAPVEGWLKNADNVPLPQDGFHWSVSHKRHFVAAVVSDKPVGIDVEHVQPRRSTLSGALARSVEWVTMGDRSWPSFFRLWTAKEAALKAVGTGISALMDCRLLEVLDQYNMRLLFQGREWLIEHFYHSDHLFAVTSYGHAVRWCVLPRENSSSYGA